MDFLYKATPFNINLLNNNEPNKNHFETLKLTF